MEPDLRDSSRRWRRVPTEVRRPSKFIEKEAFPCERAWRPGRRPPAGAEPGAFLPVGSRGIGRPTCRSVCVSFPGPQQTTSMLPVYQKVPGAARPQQVSRLDRANAGGRGYFRIAYAAIWHPAAGRVRPGRGRGCRRCSLSADVDAGRNPEGELLNVLPMVAKARSPRSWGWRSIWARYRAFVSESHRSNTCVHGRTSLRRSGRGDGSTGRRVVRPHPAAEAIALAACKAKIRVIAPPRTVAADSFANPTASTRSWRRWRWPRRPRRNAQRNEKLEASTDQRQEPAGGAVAGQVMRRPGQRAGRWPSWQRTERRGDGPVIQTAMVTRTRGHLYDYVSRNYEQGHRHVALGALTEGMEGAFRQAHRKTPTRLLREKVKNLPAAENGSTRHRADRSVHRAPGEVEKQWGCSRKAVNAHTGARPQTLDGASARHLWRGVT